MKKNKELAWYRTRAARLAGEVAQLRETLRRQDEGTAQLHLAANGLLCQTALTYGREVADEETGEVLGRRLELPLYDAGELMARYEIHARRDREQGKYFVGVVEKS